jgi:hypothetical protein
MRVLVFLILNAVLVFPVAAQAPLELVSEVESGWTSNATEAEGGAPDFYLRQNHDLSIRGTLGPLALRAGVIVEHKAFRHLSGENDLSVTGGLEAGLDLKQGVALRLGYALTQEWAGEMLDLGPFMLTINSPATRHEALAEVVATGSGRAVIMGVDIVRRQPGLSEFSGLPIAPLVIEPEVTEVTARVDGEWAMTPGVTGLARLHWVIVGVPEADRLDFGREPASIARLAGGLRLRQGGVTATSHAGVELVWPQDAPHLVRAVPYFDAKAEWAVTELINLEAMGSAGVEVFNPIDGVASHEMEGDLGMRLALSETVGLSLGAAASLERGLYDESIVTEQRSLRSGLSWMVSPLLEAGLEARYAEFTELGQRYPVSTIALTLGGRV